MMDLIFVGLISRQRGTNTMQLVDFLHDFILNNDVPSLELDIMAATMTCFIFIFAKLMT
jgi:hypothetical protein